MSVLCTVYNVILLESIMVLTQENNCVNVVFKKYDNFVNALKLSNQNKCCTVKKKLTILDVIGRLAVSIVRESWSLRFQRLRLKFCLKQTQQSADVSSLPMFLFIKGHHNLRCP